MTMPSPPPPRRRYHRRGCGAVVVLLRCRCRGARLVRSEALAKKQNEIASRLEGAMSQLDRIADDIIDRAERDDVD